MKKSLFFLILMAITFASFAQVGINTDGSSPDPSAMLDVKSDTAGILIPRMTATQRDAINNPAQGLMVFVTDDNTFYYYSGTGWTKFASGENGWIVSGNYVYNADAKIGIGTTSPVAKLHIHDYINDTTLIVAQYGGGDEVKISSYILNANSGSNWHYGTFNHIVGSGTGPQIGAIQVMANTGNGWHYGTYNTLYGYGTGNQFGTYQEIYNSENGKHYGSFNKLTGSGTGNKYGTFDTIASTAGGTHYGVYSVAEGDSNFAGYFKGNMYVQDRVGIGTNTPNALLHINDTTSNDTTLLIIKSGTDDNVKYGSYLENSNSGIGSHIGSYINLTGTGNGLQCGRELHINNSGYGYHYGSITFLSGYGSGKAYGSFLIINELGDGIHYGSFNQLSGSGTGNKYGTFDTIASTAGGTHYGVYSVAEGDSNFAGYFKGNMYVQNRLGVGTDTPSALIHIYDTTQNDTSLLIKISSTSNDQIFGSFIKNTNTGFGYHFGTYNLLDGAALGRQYGSYQDIENSGNSIHYGVFNKLAGDGSGEQYGSYQYISNSGSGDHYGVRSQIVGSGNGNQYGTYQFLENQGSGKQYGSYNEIGGLGTGDKYGTYDSVYSNANGTHYGVYSVAKGADNYAGYFKGNMYVQDYVGVGTDSPKALFQINDNTSKDTSLLIIKSGSDDGVKYGIYFKNDNTGNDAHYGSYNILTGSGSGGQYGSYQYINNSGNNTHTGTFNSLAGAGNGNQYGNFQTISNSGSGKHFGSYNFLQGIGTASQFGTFNNIIGTGAGNKYGSYDSITTTAGGTHYGVYSVAEGADNYAGYFKGNVRVTEKITAPTSGADADLKPYIYGSLKDTDGSYYTLESTDGFTSTRESTGVYKITFDSYNSDKYYLVIANALRTSGPVILTYEKNYGYFRIRAWNLSGNLVDTYLNFVVYKR